MEIFLTVQTTFLEDGDLILSAEVTHLGVDKNIPDQIIKYLKKNDQVVSL